MNDPIKSMKNSTKAPGKLGTLHVNAKCSDMCFLAWRRGTEENRERREYDGYVPGWLPSPDTQHFGDYIELDIDLETGQILNWKAPDLAILRKTFSKKAPHAS